MHSLRWVCKQANAWALGQTSEEIIDLRDIGCSKDDHVPDATTTVETLATNTASLNVSAEISLPTEQNFAPRTPPNKFSDPSPHRKKIEDSGYFSAYETCGKRCFEHDDDEETTPTKRNRPRPETSFREREAAIRSAYEQANAREQMEKEEHGRLRHDSVLSEPDDLRQDDSETMLKMQNVDTVERASNEHLDSDKLLECCEQCDVQVVYNDDTDECEVLSAQLSRTTISSHEKASPPATVVHERVKISPLLPPREVINAPFESQISPASRFWKVADGIDDSRILQQVSCLQCILKKLPCDKRLPHCSRCVRSGHGPCLVQRELLAEERWEAGLWGITGSVGYTVLVRLQGDDEEGWETKKGLEEAMLSYLEERTDKGNWVAPLDTGIRGTYKKADELYRRRLQLDYARGHV